MGGIWPGYPHEELDVAPTADYMWIQGLRLLILWVSAEKSGIITVIHASTALVV